MRWFRLDLQADLGTARLPYRRLRVLLAHLPREAAYVQAVLGESASWGQTEHLLATVADVLVRLNHNFVQSRSTTRIPDPKPFPRPGQAPVDDGKRRLGGEPMSIRDFERRKAAFDRAAGDRKSKVEEVGGD